MTVLSPTQWYITSLTTYADNSANAHQPYAQTFKFTHRPTTMQIQEAHDHRIVASGLQRWPRWRSRRRVALSYQLTGSFFSHEECDRFRLALRQPCIFMFHHDFGRKHCSDAENNHGIGSGPSTPGKFYDMDQEDTSDEVDYVVMTELNITPKQLEAGDEGREVYDYTMTLRRMRYPTEY